MADKFHGAARQPCRNRNNRGLEPRHVWVRLVLGDFYLFYIIDYLIFIMLKACFFRRFPWICTCTVNCKDLWHDGLEVLTGCQNIFLWGRTLCLCHSTSTTSAELTHQWGSVDFSGFAGSKHSDWSKHNLFVDDEKLCLRKTHSNKAFILFLVIAPWPWSEDYDDYVRTWPRFKFANDVGLMPQLGPVDGFPGGWACPKGWMTWRMKEHSHFIRTWKGFRGCRSVFRP